MFEKGCIIERGIYSDLVSKKGYFYNLERGTDFLWYFFHCYFVILFKISLGELFKLNKIIYVNTINHNPQFLKDILQVPSWRPQEFDDKNPQGFPRESPRGDSLYDHWTRKV